MKSVRLLSPLLCLLLLGQASVDANAEIEEEEGVLVLKTANFEKALEQFPHILVEFCEWAEGDRLDRAGGMMAGWLGGSAPWPLCVLRK